MIKKIAVFLLAFTFLFYFRSGTSAKVLTLVSPAPSPTPQVVNSYELFWPMVSGKTIGDSWYSLKIFKEKIRSALIFGKAQKADNYLFLAAKRLLETEKLLTDKKEELASKSFDNFLNNLKLSLDNWEEAKTTETTTPAIKENISNRLNNVDVLLKYLSTQYSGDIKSKIDRGLEEVGKFLKSP